MSDDQALRELALEAAIRTTPNDGESRLVVEKARNYFKFLKGEELQPINPVAKEEAKDDGSLVPLGATFQEFPDQPGPTGKPAPDWKRKKGFA